MIGPKDLRAASRLRDQGGVNIKRIYIFYNILYISLSIYVILYLSIYLSM